MIHLYVFSEQFVAMESVYTIVDPASILTVSLNPEYAEHLWGKITASGNFTKYDP